MELKSCSLYGRCRDRNTGKLTKVSELHRDLVGLGKIQKAFTRLKANKAFYLSQSPKFLDRYSDDMVFTSEDADSEPKLASFFEAAHQIMPEVTYENIRELLAKKFKEGVYSYEDAYERMSKFNTLMDGGTSFIGTLIPQEDGKYMFKIVPNTAEEQQALTLVLADRNTAETIIKELERLGIGIAEGARSLYNSKNPSTLVNGLLGLITLKGGQEASAYHIKDLASETGHVIVEMLGKDSKFYQRLRKAIEQNPDVVRELLGAEEYALYENTKDAIDEYMGHIVGLYLELWDNIKPNTKLKTIGTLILRIVDWLYSKLHLSNRDFYAARYNAKWAAYSMVKNFMGNNFLGNLETALSEKKLLFGDLNTISGHLEVSLEKLLEVLESSKDFGYKVNKNYKDTFNYLLTLLHEVNLLKLESRTFENSRIIEEASARAMLKLVNFVANEIQLSKVLLEASLRGLDGNNNPINTSQQAKVIKYCLQVLNMALQTLNYLTDFEQITDQRLKNEMIRVFSALSKVTNTFSSRYTASGQSEEVIESGYQAMIEKARRNLALKLLVEVNGNDFIAISQHVHFLSGKLVREAAKAQKLEDILSENVTVSWVSRWIDSLADSPDKVNLIIYDAVELKKHEANVKTLDIKDKLFDLYRELKMLGVSDTRMFYETDSQGHLTGNFISERNWGEWERLYKEDKKKFEETWYENVGSKLNIPKSEMYHNTQFLMAFGAWREGWHGNHSVKLELKDDNGNPLTYEDGKTKVRWAPVISTDAGADSKPIVFDNSKWEELQENDALSNWFKKYMSLKKELDSLLPDGCTNALGVRAPQFVGTTTDRLVNAFKGTGKIKRVMNMSLRRYITYNIKLSPSDTEFGGEHDTYDQDDLYDNGSVIFSRARQNYVKSMERTPLYGVKKLPNIDDLSTDLIHSTLAYASMAYSYNCLDEVAEVATQIAESRVDVLNNSTWMTKLFKNHKSWGYDRLVDYLQQLVYNNYVDPHFSTGTIPTARKVAGIVSRLGSLWMLGWNVHSALTNAFTGFNEIWKEAHGGEDFNKRLFGWACMLYIRYWGIGFLLNMCNIAIKDGSIIEDTTKMRLFSRIYDIQNENERKFRDYHIQTKGWGFMLGWSYTNIAMLPYSITDQWMQTISFLACAKSTKLKNKKNGKEYSLWDAYTVVQDEKKVIDKNGKEQTIKSEPRLVLKDIETGKEGSEKDWLILDRNLLKLNTILSEKEKRGEELTTAEVNAIYQFEMVPGVEEFTGRTKNPDGTPYMIKVRKKNPETGEDMLIDPYKPFDLVQLNRFRTRCRAINNRMHGVYNRGDGGAFQKYAIASVAASMKKYAIGLIDRRFSGTRYDFRTGEMRLGSTITMANIFVDCFTAYSSGEDSTIINFLDGLKYSDGHFLGWPAKLLYGIIKFMYITLGPSFSKFGVDLYLRKRGYSNNQIANVRRFWGDIMAPLFLQLSMSFLTPPPDDDEDDEDKTLMRQLHDYVQKGVDKLLDSWPVEFMEDRAEDVYLFILNHSIFGPIFGDLTVDDETVLTKEWQENVIRRSTKSTKVKPFDARAILYYQFYRALLELKAYDITKISSIFQEYKGLTDSALPGTTALMDIYSTFSLCSTTLSEEALELMPEDELSKYVNGKEIYTRGDNKYWYKWAKKMLKVTPTRSLETWFNGYASYESMKWYKEPWSKKNGESNKFTEGVYNISRR